MLMPTLFDRDFFNDFFDDPFFGSKDMKKMEKKMNSRRAQNLMKTDVRETADTYEMKVELPGFKKENISAELKDGYLTVTANKGADKDEKDKDGKYIRQERYSGTCARTFYVGEGVTQEDIHAKFEDGILKLSVPKKDAKAVEQKKYISIEG